MGIAQKLPDGAKNTYDFLVRQGYGKPETRRLPYNDFGIVLFAGRDRRPRRSRR